MKLSTAIHLSRSRTAADRSRIRLTTVAVGISGALLIGALRISRLGPGDLPTVNYSNYLAEEDLRSGVITVFVLLAALAAGLAVQALRIGVAARERRLSAVRLAGGSARQLKQLSAADAALAGLTGGLLAAPIYLFLTLVLLSVLPPVSRLLPGLDAADLPAWLACTLVTTLAGAVLGWSLTSDRRPDEPVSAFGGRRPAIVVAVATVVLGFVLLLSSLSDGDLFVFLAMPFVVLVLAPRWTRRIGHRLTRSGAPVNVLTGARLVTDSRPTGRMSALLACCGLLIGFLVNSTLGLAMEKLPVGAADRAMHLTGLSFGILGLLLIVATAIAALLVGAADQLVDQRRQLACLTAFGVDARFLRRVVERQLALAACPALGIGLFLGCLLGLGAGRSALSDFGLLPLFLSSLVLAVVGVGLGLLGARLAGFLLRNQVHDALAPENLRAA
ncbi:hypothetical protein OHA70_08910 [Kribbella sp. NBC_00382]|uniref:hypothetical protein n=1 Tax=Kribbella sp. NBC_00382 TaxID=2975967 RepID=UPI002E1E7F12